MKKLPIGRQEFKIIREKDYLYVDKTKYIYDMISNGDIYFLSRPRRFGKSLLLSTIENLYTKEKKLFEGLHIYDRWGWDKTNPVIKLDFSEGSYSSVNGLKNSLDSVILLIAEDHGIELITKTIPNKFGEFIRQRFFIDMNSI
ncbi:MAG: AAA family ATPase [Methanobrevibacter sp.]|jgi:hypothetical protein|nr:AAA family ATPase [Candidatus Methanovirga aequatorialis]